MRYLVLICLLAGCGTERHAYVDRDHYGSSDRFDRGHSAPEVRRASKGGQEKS